MTYFFLMTSLQHKNMNLVSLTVFFPVFNFQFQSILILTTNYYKWYLLTIVYFAQVRKYVEAHSRAVDRAQLRDVIRI